MRIAILGIKRLPAQAGADRVVESLLRHLPSEHEYTVYLLDSGERRPDFGEHVRYVELPALGGKHLRAASYFLMCSLHFALRGTYDLAHVHNSDFGVFCPILRLRRNVRVVGTFHGDPYMREKWSRPAKAFLRLSEWAFVRSCHHLTSVAPSKAVRGRRVEFIPNGLEAAPVRDGRREAGMLYEKLGVAASEYALFACARLDSTKGLHHLLRAYREVAWPPRLLVVGDFRHDARYADTVRALAGEDSRVVICDELLPHDLLFQVVRDSAYFVFPSEVEAMSMMLLEAVAWQRPVVASDIFENVVVLGEDYPFLFASGDPSDLRRVLEDPRLTSPDAGAAVEQVRQGAESRFNWNTAAAAYAALYSGAGLSDAVAH